MNTDVHHDDAVLPSLLAAGMNAGTRAATAGADTDLHYNALLEQVTTLLVDLYGAETLYRELCSTAGLVLMLRELNVRIGEVVFSRTDRVWTFTLDTTDLGAAGTASLRRAAQLVTVYANVLQQFDDEWTREDNPFWDPTSGITADEQAWDHLAQSVPDSDVILTGKSLFVLAGVLSQWATS